LRCWRQHRRLLWHWRLLWRYARSIYRRVGIGNMRDIAHLPHLLLTHLVLTNTHTHQLNLALATGERQSKVALKSVLMPIFTDVLPTP
jgi:hypothetical protein